MIRVVAFLVVTALLALGVVWLADRPGQVAITWLGYRTDTSVMVAMAAIGIVALRGGDAVVAAARAVAFAATVRLRDARTPAAQGI